MTVLLEESQSLWNTIKHYSILLFKFLVILFPIVLTLLALFYWTYLTSCFQRYVFILCSWMIYWWFIHDLRTPINLIEIGVFAVLFGIVEWINQGTMETDPKCVDSPPDMPMLLIIRVTCWCILYIHSMSFAVFCMFLILTVVDKLLHAEEKKRGCSG